MQKKIILASASPRRRQLLKQIGINFDAVPSEIDENNIIDSNPLINIQKIALLKAQDVAKKIAKGIIIGADTQVLIDNEILGKPVDAKNAFNMLSKLNGRTHRVITGVALLDTETGFEETWVETTFVTFRELEIDEIEDYLRTGEYKDKAGAYGIQERAAAFVERIEGCYFNVVGLPLAKLSQKIRMLQLLS